MKKQTATIERYHVYGTPRYCLALSYRGEDLTPCEKNDRGGIIPGLHQLIPDDAEGVQTLRNVAKARGFTHVKIAGDWTKRTKPHGGRL